MINEKNNSLNLNENLYIKPPINLLSELTVSSLQSDNECLKKANKIKEVFKNYKIKSEFIDYKVSYQIIRFIFKFSKTDIKKIDKFKFDIQTVLKCFNVLITESTENSEYINIDVPNLNPSVLPLKTLLEDETFLTSTHDDLFVLGKSVEGQSVYQRLSQTPSILVSGISGAGKSIFLNSLIVSLLYKASPKDLKMLLIDPKIVEFYHFSGLPHLLTQKPISDSKKAIKALQYIVEEMNNRYVLFEKVKARTLEEYNNCELVKNGEYSKKEKILIVIDEFTELISNNKDFEMLITQLTQKSRTAGIYLVLSTQRANTNTLTANLRANIQTKVSFKQITYIDSRIILGNKGAEDLIGKGDMLCKINGSEIHRLQGAYVSDKDVIKVINFIKENNVCELNNKLEELIINALLQEDNNTSKPIKDFTDVELCEKILEIVKTLKVISKANVQRKLQIGFNRVSRLFDVLVELEYIEYKDNKYRLVEK